MLSMKNKAATTKAAATTTTEKHDNHNNKVNHSNTSSSFNNSSSSTNKIRYCIMNDSRDGDVDGVDAEGGCLRWETTSCRGGTGV